METNEFSSSVRIKHLFPTTHEKRAFHKTFVNEKVENYSHIVTYFVTLILSSSINNFLRDTTKSIYLPTKDVKRKPKKLCTNYLRIIYYRVWTGKRNDAFRRPNFNFNPTIDTPKSRSKKKIKHCQDKCVGVWQFKST